MKRVNLNEKHSHEEGPADNLGSGRDVGIKGKGMDVVKAVANNSRTQDKDAGHAIGSDWNGTDTPRNTNANNKF